MFWPFSKIKFLNDMIYAQQSTNEKSLNKITLLEKMVEFQLGVNETLKLELQKAEEREKEFKEKLFELSGITKVKQTNAVTHSINLNGNRGWKQVKEDLEKKSLEASWLAKQKEAERITSLEKEILETGEKKGDTPMNLKEIAKKIVEVGQYIPVYGPIFKMFVPSKIGDKYDNIEHTVEDTFTKLTHVVLDAQVIGEQLRLDGPNKLAIALPKITQLITDSAALAGSEIDNKEEFAISLVDLNNAINRMIKSLRKK